MGNLSRRYLIRITRVPQPPRGLENLIRNVMHDGRISGNVVEPKLSVKRFDVVRRRSSLTLLLYARRKILREKRIRGRKTFEIIIVFTRRGVDVRRRGGRRIVPAAVYNTISRSFRLKSIFVFRYKRQLHVLYEERRRPGIEYRPVRKYNAVPRSILGLDGARVILRFARRRFRRHR